MEPDVWAPGERGRIVVLALAVVGAMCYPLRQHLRATGRRVDGFPLSYYPMFTARRRRTAKVNYVAAVRTDGSRHPVPYQVLGSGGFNQVRHQLNRVVTSGSAQAYAEALAARLAACPAQQLAGVVRVEVLRGRFDVDACMMQRRITGDDTLLAAVDLQSSEPAARLRGTPSTVAPEVPPSGVPA
jgi:hypothetical protein